MNFRQLYRNCKTAQKPVYKPMELILNKKKRHVSLRFLKKISLKTFGLCISRHLTGGTNVNTSEPTGSDKHLSDTTTQPYHQHALCSAACIL